MACDCLRAANEHLAAHNTRLCENFVPWVDGPIVVLTLEQISADVPTVAIVMPIFCPLCGERYTATPPIGVTTTGEISNYVH